MKNKGIVYLVGAGPGDAGLLTVRGAELLRGADVVVYDALVNPDLLKLAPPGAEIIYGGKRSHLHAMPQEELNRLLIAKARAGLCVVRLKGGDPYVFGRGGEEAEELASAKIPFAVVPGISSAIAAPNYAGIPVTHREHCSSVTIFTGHEDPAKAESSVDWAQVARTSGTKIIMMGLRRIREIMKRLIACGMSPETPVGMIRWGTTGRQQSLTGTLATMADIAEQANLSAPVVTVIGEVVKLREKLNWFENLPLFGQRIVVTRSRDQASPLSQQLTERGAEVMEIPTIKVAPPTEHQAILDALLELNAYDWLVFTSPNGVGAFFGYFFKAFADMRDIGGVRIAAVGPATAAKLKELHLKVDLMPETSTAKKIAEAFAKYESIENLKILLARAEVANQELPEKLSEMGAIVDDIAFYRTVPETEDQNGAAAKLNEHGADWLTFTSSSTVENFHARFHLPELVKKFPQMKLASIGPETTQTLLNLGLKPALEAKSHTVEGLVKALEKAAEKRPG